MARRYWTCRKCAHRNERTASRKCQGCGEQTKPKTRRAKHSEVLRGDTYPLFVRAAVQIHGVTDESCCVCRKPRSQERRHDRDHDHKTGEARGLACAGNRGCNVLMLSWVTSGTARGIADAKAKAGEADAPRWVMIAEYLERCEIYYAALPDPAERERIVAA